MHLPAFTTVTHLLFLYASFYPLFMSYLWMTGGLIYWWNWERRQAIDRPPELPEHPLVSILIPCHNEELDVEETVQAALRTQYPVFEVIAINDGSTDRTAAILDRIAATEPLLRVVHLDSNQGKAMAMRMGALVARGEFLVCVDGDAWIGEHAVSWMMQHFLSSPRVAAVTGNPRVRNRSTLLGRIQVGECSAIIGLIKRAQRVYGRVFTVSGVIAGFRRSALHEVGYWDMSMITDDIDVSWALLLRHWEIRYEQNALCWMLMPETLHGLWRQRLRWAQGGAEVVLKFGRRVAHWREHRMWLLCLEFFASTLWSYVFVTMVLLWLIGLVVDLPEPLQVHTIVPSAAGAVLGATCMLQFMIGLLIDGRYERGTRRNYYWIIWYPMIYFLMAAFTSVVGVPRALMKRRGQRAIWTSPDRGVRTAP